MNNNCRVAERKRGKHLGVIRFPQNGEGYVPGIRVAGKWLHEFGFNIGDNVTLTASDSLIVIQKEKGQGNGKESN